MKTKVVALMLGVCLTVSSLAGAGNVAYAEELVPEETAESDESEEETSEANALEEADEIIDTEKIDDAQYCDTGLYASLADVKNGSSAFWKTLRRAVWEHMGEDVSFYVDKEAFSYLKKTEAEQQNQTNVDWVDRYLFDYVEERPGAEGWSGDYMFLHGTASWSSFLYSDWNEMFAVEHNGKIYQAATLTLNSGYGVDHKTQEPKVEAFVKKLVGEGGALDKRKYPTDAAKANAAYQWVVNNISYESGYNSNQNSFYYFAYAGFFEKKGSCECMAQCFYYICKEMGLGCRILFDNNGHVYNLVRIGSDWYYTDCSARQNLKGSGSMGFTPAEYIYATWTWSWSAFKQNYLNKVPYNDYQLSDSDQGSKFVDVDMGRYYGTPIKWAVERGVTTGTSDSTFSPDDDCNRAQVVTFLWRAKGCPEPNITSSPFKDVQDSGRYFYKAILWAAENGITTGTSPDKFSPDDTVTRGQFVTFLYRAQGYPGINGGCNFKDVKTDKFYCTPIIWAAENGVTTGTSPTEFSPEDPCSRAQVVTFIYRALH